MIKWLEIGGYKYCYHKTSGANKDAPIVILTGAFQSILSWEKYAKDLAENGPDVYILNLPGTGESDILPEHYGINVQSIAICDLFKEESLKQISLIAPSLGSLPGYKYASEFPFDVKNLILAATMSQANEDMRPFATRSLESIKSGDTKRFASEILGISGKWQGKGMLCVDLDAKIPRQAVIQKLLYTQLAKLSENDQERYRTNTLRVMHEPAMDIRKPPTCPVLVFTGEYDCFTPPEKGLELAKALPNSMHMSVIGGDHFVHIQQPKVITSIFNQFTAHSNLDGVEGIKDLVRFKK